MVWPGADDLIVVTRPCNINSFDVTNSKCCCASRESPLCKVRHGRRRSAPLLAFFDHGSRAFVPKTVARSNERQERATGVHCAMRINAVCDFRPSPRAPVGRLRPVGWVIAARWLPWIAVLLRRVASASARLCWQGQTCYNLACRLTPNERSVCEI